MAKETTIIKILTYQLPFDLSNQIYNEHQNRLKEAFYLIDNYSGYKSLKRHKQTVESFLALSIFHKRVISNLDAAVKFYGTVSTKSQANTINIGSYKLTFEEKNKILGVIMGYNKLIERFSIPPSFMDYTETKEFLKNLINLKSSFQYARSQKKSPGKSKAEDEDNLPF
jgi:hypothetical protein